MNITIEIDDGLDDAVKIDLMNKLWVEAETTTKERFKKAWHDGDPKLSKLANDEWDRWSKFRWE
jgi:hypothetical protein